MKEVSGHADGFKKAERDLRSNETGNEFEAKASVKDPSIEKMRSHLRLILIGGLVGVIICVKQGCLLTTI